jgi:hypothetical protein
MQAMRKKSDQGIEINGPSTPGFAEASMNFRRNFEKMD